MNRILPLALLLALCSSTSAAPTIAHLFPAGG